MPTNSESLISSGSLIIEGVFLKTKREKKIFFHSVFHKLHSKIELNPRFAAPTFIWLLFLFTKLQTKDTPAKLNNSLYRIFCEKIKRRFFFI